MMLPGILGRARPAQTSKNVGRDPHHAWSPTTASGSLPEASFIAFITMWTFIGLVSAYDGYLTVRYQEMLHNLEQNPIGRWIMDLDSGLVLNKDLDYVVANRQLANFLGLKFAGTVLGLGIMLVVHRYKASLGLMVTGVIAALQGVLALYLSCF